MKNLQTLFEHLTSTIEELEITQRNSILQKIEKMYNKNLERLTSNLPQDRGYTKELAEEYKESSLRRVEEEIYYWRLSLKYKLFTSLSVYISPDDKISDITTYRGPKGLEIHCYVTRDNESYRFETTAITAGGYNIQCFHYRYIVTTNLPKVESTKTIYKYFRLLESKETLEYQLKKMLELGTPTVSMNNYSSLEFSIKTYNYNCESIRYQIQTLEEKIKTLLNN